MLGTFESWQSFEYFGGVVNQAFLSYICLRKCFVLHCLIILKFTELRFFIIIPASFLPLEGTHLVGAFALLGKVNATALDVGVTRGNIDSVLYSWRVVDTDEAVEVALLEMVLLNATRRQQVVHFGWQVTTTTPHF